MFNPTRHFRSTAQTVPVAKVVFVAVLSACALYVLYSQLSHIDFRAVGNVFHQITLTQWAASLALSAFSFLAIGQYDATWHRLLRTGVPSARARRSGMAAIAIGQTLGLCALTSAFVRWRLLRMDTIGDVARISAAVAASFVTAWAICAIPALMHLAQRAALPIPSPAITLSLVAVIGLCLWRICNQGTYRKRDFLALGFWTLCDVAAAAAALYVLLPEGSDIAFATLLAAYVVALGAGILSNTPGGIGVFDLILLAVIATPSVEPIVAAILAFRITYYLIPFTISCAVLFASSKRQSARPLVQIPAAVLQGFLHDAAPAAWGLARQNGQILRGRNLHFFTADAPLCLVALGDPLRARPDVLGTAQLSGHAKERGRWPVFYQASPRTAAAARREGWKVLAIARRAYLNPQEWSTAGSSKQGLRRKLKKAAKAGVTVEKIEPADCADELSRVATTWAQTHGGEMGFSMGRYSPRAVKNQAVFLINVEGNAQGFISFHTSRSGWALDLIRYEKDLPQGATQTAIVSAIAAARDSGIAELCLAAAPIETGWVARLCRTRSGVAQFKRSFGPSWQNLYLCAPHVPSVVVACGAIVWKIQRPVARLRMLLTQSQ